jgi:membrane protein DedA with SNARE-associated domain
MVPGLRSVVSIPAGMLRMPLDRFALLTAAGAALLDALLLGLGWCLGSNWRQVTAIAGSTSNGSTSIAVLLVALVAALAGPAI